MLTGSGCTGQHIDPRGSFVEDGVAEDALADWAGERIDVANLGVTTTGGLSVVASVDRARVHAVARLLAIANSDDKRNADLAISDVTASFAITRDSSATAVTCRNGSTHGSAAALDSGCDALDVSLPAGDRGRPLSVTARSGKGRMVIDLGAATLLAVELHASQGSSDVTVASTPGATIDVVAETGEDVLLRLPRDFAADLITLDTTGSIDTSAFPDVQSGKGRGAAGSGASRISVRSVRVGNATGRIVLGVR